VYQNSVPLSVTTSLNGTLYRPFTTNSNGIVFKSIDGSSTVTIQVTKESDGHFWVTGVQKN
jgi:predicted aspartyl protease